jgi:hypothetical protein
MHIEENGEVGLPKGKKRKSKEQACKHGSPERFPRGILITQMHIAILWLMGGG